VIALTIRRRLKYRSRVATSYRYELKRGDEVLATGHLSSEPPFAVGDPITVNGREGIIRTVAPLLADTEQRIVIQLLRHGDVDQRGCRGGDEDR
jgi:hypothetical protein